ncbi:hypothetical protein B0J14DRAFT_701674 [Halenospora varia]|nr:hypothetical protein B0J14DRAFT_701674 [Halenospora varia]
MQFSKLVVLVVAATGTQLTLAAVEDTQVYSTSVSLSSSAHTQPTGAYGSGHHTKHTGTHTGHHTKPTGTHTKKHHTYPHGTGAHTDKHHASHTKTHTKKHTKTHTGTHSVTKATGYPTKAVTTLVVPTTTAKAPVYLKDRDVELEPIEEEDEDETVLDTIKRWLSPRSEEEEEAEDSYYVAASGTAHHPTGTKPTFHASGTAHPSGYGGHKTHKTKKHHTKTKTGVHASYTHASGYHHASGTHKTSHHTKPTHTGTVHPKPTTFKTFVIPKTTAHVGY